MADYGVTEAIYNRLKGDSELTNMLSTYGGQPAIFTAQKPPSDARYRYMVVKPPISNTDEIAEDNKGKNGLQEIRDLFAWQRTDTSVKELEKIINRARELCHRNGDKFNFPNRTNVRVRASGPTEAPRQENEGHGLMFTLKITTQEARD